MNLMLCFMFVCLGLGLLAGRFGARQRLAVTGLATLMTAVYYVFGYRYM
jgi:hypothetical protein